MPGGDGTGPMGAGPMTGRAAGYCAGYGMPGYMNPVGAGRYASARGPALPYGYGQRAYGYGLPYGRRVSRWFARGFGFGRGFGRGRRRGRGRFGFWW